MLNYCDFIQVFVFTSYHHLNAMLHQPFVFLGQLWQLFEVSQILEFLR